MSLRSRLEAAEARVGRVVNGHDGIQILGGIEADASDKFAWVGQELVERLGGETSAAFRMRVMMTARAAREHAVFGGLPPMPMNGDA
jgi:hypothetical protein